MSPVDAGNSASESDETSDDDSIKFDTIKLSRRKTVVPTEISSTPQGQLPGEPWEQEPVLTKPPTTAISNPSSADLFNKINNNLPIKTTPIQQANSPLPKTRQMEKKMFRLVLIV